MLLTAAAIVLSLLVLAPLVSTMYLLLLTLAAFRTHRSQPHSTTPRHRFAILIPAHNEEALIGRLLDNLKCLVYPVSLIDTWVVADNCEDATASIGRARGVHVLERHHPTARAKGFALRSLLEHLSTQSLHYDGYVVLDADSVVAPNFLASMDAHLSAGSKVVQAYYSVLNAQASPLAGLRFAALAAIHYLRPLGRSGLGLSVGLKGNGMCFGAPVLERFAWNWFSLAEDVEFHLALVQAGFRVDFAADTYVLADMPVTLAQADSQNTRWELGRLELTRRCVPALLRAAVRRRSLIALDAAIEQLLPPLSVPIGISLTCVATGVGLGLPLPVLLGALSLAGLVAYLLAGLALVRAPISAYRALAYAPMYLAWKLGLYVRALVLPPRGRTWVRTARFTDAA